jgi:SPP1 family predicted phage head-tail adaptor
MDAGRLRHFVTFEQPLVVVDDDSDDMGDGSRDEQWVPAFGGQMIPVSIEPLSGRELIAAQAVQSRISSRVVMRYRPGITAAMRMLHRGTIYNIEAPIPDPVTGVDSITLLVSSGVNDG